jgi:hypothetical protein
MPQQSVDYKGRTGAYGSSKGQILKAAPTHARSETPVSTAGGNRFSVYARIWWAGLLFCPPTDAIRSPSDSQADVMNSNLVRSIQPQHFFADPKGFTPRMNALMNLPSTWGARASTSTPFPARNSRASSTA